MKQFTLGCIGVGNMASAILSGVLEKEYLSPEQIALFDIHPEQTEKFAGKGATAFESIPKLVEHSQTVLLAVKPQQFPEVLPLVKEALTPETLVVSIAAGITADHLKDALGEGANIVLAMPNTPLMVGQGATVLAKVPPTTLEQFQQVKEIFSCAGIVEELSAEQMNDSIPLHGSSPAFIYEFARQLVDCGAYVGIPKETALRLVSQTLIGSGAMLLTAEKSPEELIQMVCSPGGTTLAGMKALEDSGFAQAVENAYSATVWRGKELAGTTPAKENVTVEIGSTESPWYEKGLELRRKELRAPLGLDVLESDLETDKTAIHFWAVQEGQVLATCQLQPRDAFIIKLAQLVVDPSAQRGGIGSLLLHNAVEYAKESDFARMTADGREEAKGFYLRQGFLARGTPFLKHGIPHISLYKELD